MAVCTQGLHAGVCDATRYGSGLTLCCTHVRDHLGLAQLLLKHGADPNARDVDGQTLLHISSREGDWKVAKELMKLNVGMNSRDDQGRTPLQVA